MSFTTPGVGRPTSLSCRSSLLVHVVMMDIDKGLGKRFECFENRDVVCGVMVCQQAVGMSFTTPRVGRPTSLSCSSSFLVCGVMLGIDKGLGKGFEYFENCDGVVGLMRGCQQAVGISFITPRVRRPTSLSCRSSCLVRGVMVSIDKGSGKRFGYFENRDGVCGSDGVPAGACMSFTTPRVGRPTSFSCSSSILVRGVMLSMDEGSGEEV
jgi:hypothetical protein